MGTTDKSTTLVEFKVNDKGTGVLGGISRAYNAFQEKIASANQKVAGSFDSGNLLKKNMQGLNKSVLGGFGSISQGLNLGMGSSIGSAAIIGAIARNFSNLESVMVDVSLAVKDITEGELKELKKQIIDIGAEFPVTSTQVAKAAAVLGREKYSFGELQKSLKPIILADLASQTNDPDASAKAMTAIQRASNAPIEKLMQSVDRSLATQKFFGQQASLVNLGEAYRRAGLAFREFGISQEESLAIVGNLMQKGFGPDTAATTIEAMLRDIKMKAMPSLKGAGMQKAFFGDDRKFNSLLEFLDEFNKRGLDPYKLFGDEARRGVLATKQGRDDISQFMTQSIGLNDKGVDRSAGLAEMVQGKVAKTFKYQLDALLGDLEALGDKLAESGLMDILRDTVKEIGKVIDEVSKWPQEQKQLLVKGLLFGAISGPLMGFLGGIAKLGALAPAGAVLWGLSKLIQGIWWVSQKLLEESPDSVKSGLNSYDNAMSKIPSIWEMWGWAMPESTSSSPSASSAMDRLDKSLGNNAASKAQASLFIELQNRSDAEVKVSSDKLDEAFPLGVKLGMSVM